MKGTYNRWTILALLPLFFVNSCAFNTDTDNVYLSEMPLRDKIAQMIIIEGKIENLQKVSNLNIGGIFLFALKDKDEYSRLIKRFQDNSKYGLFVATDLEGCVNMLENIRKFKYFNEIESAEEAYRIGDEMGLVMRGLGFNLNFAPVLDLEDTIWNCRSFIGTPEEITEKGLAFLDGLQSAGVMGTSKHFPGRTLDIADTHREETHAVISEEDLIPFYSAIKNKSNLIMLNHLVVTGEIDSDGLPASVSPVVIQNIRDRGYDGFIITDDLKMKGVSLRYRENPFEIYVDAINAGNDLLLNVYEEDPDGAIDYIEESVLVGRIDEEKIDTAVKKILERKGIKAL